MSSIELEIKICETHQLEIVAVDLKAAKEKKEKFLCVKCLIKRVDENYIVLLKEGLKMIQDMKQKCKIQVMNDTQKTLENIKNLQTSVSEINKLFSDTFRKLQDNFDDNIKNSNKSEIQFKEQSVEELKFDQDFETLSIHYKGNLNYDIPKEKVNIDEFKELMENVQSQLSYMANAQQFSQIFGSITKIKSQYQIEQPIPQKEVDKHKTLSLSQRCINNDHGLEIIMIHLNEKKNESNQSRLACSRCIQQYPKRKYITIEDANIKWKEFKRQQNQMITNYNNNRFNKFTSAIKSIQQLKDIYNQTLTDIIQQLERKRIINKDMLSANQTVVGELYELNDQEIQKAVEIICLKDNHKKLKKEQVEQDQIDAIFFQNLKQNLENLMKYDLLTKHNLLRIQNQNQQQQLVDEIKQVKEIEKAPDMNLFFLKFELQVEYISILDDVFNFYKTLQQEIDDLQKKGKLSELLNSKQETQSQIIKQQYETFKQNSDKIKLLMMAEANYKQLSTLTEQLTQNKQQQQTIQTQLNNQNKQVETMNLQIEQAKQENKKNLEEKEKFTQKVEILNQQIEQLKQEKKEEILKKDEYFKQIEPLKQEIQQLKQENTRIQQDAQGKLTIKDQDIARIQQQYNQSSQDLKQLKEQSKLLSTYFSGQVFNQIETKVKKTIKCQLLIYQATKDGLNQTSFWNKINGKSNLLIIFKSKNGRIFGGFSPCQWLQTINGYVQDDTLSSFIFSQTHNQFYPLKEANKANAIYCHSNQGPVFGSGHDLQIGTDFQSGTSILGTSYQIDQHKITTQNIHLFGQATPNLDECEVFELILK
ncbi:unnamed protein product (macronuclear) [Paramecium tetraurelia]|uniref:TLDc domain-containing protein n=1 Tax=Paramecium tetraurelia TaxID=5888 RepID=A0BY45_PARTE|nr:uncharacterized protein GSPATT00033315001 [Paramecium tetraurelia]CAK63462.1 unnamed protein product [Paramecium tetraurelia]|eukprot:XP_001430860.1 hypothetical protein (macronuclear) [Paramecium tetraurelia strain d4-2]